MSDSPAQRLMHATVGRVAPRGGLPPGRGATTRRRAHGRRPLACAGSPPTLSGRAGRAILSSLPLPPGLPAKWLEGLGRSSSSWQAVPARHLPIGSPSWPHVAHAVCKHPESLDIYRSEALLRTA
eukprot:scaffold4163_cov425-Prasinococcus_capsulatus_cf.AAC.11